jgi:hypothetical protein
MFRDADWRDVRRGEISRSAVHRDCPDKLIEVEELWMASFQSIPCKLVLLVQEP